MAENYAENLITSNNKTAWKLRKPRKKVAA